MNDSKDLFGDEVSNTIRKGALKELTITKWPNIVQIQVGQLVLVYSLNKVITS